MNRLLKAALAFATVTIPSAAYAAAPSLSVSLDSGAEGPTQVGAAVKMLAVLTVLALAPAIMLATTSFVRIIVVLSFVRNAIGTQTAPPTQVLTSLALLLTVAVMAPVGKQLYQDGLGPYLDGKMQAAEAFEKGSAPVRDFMMRQTRESDLAAFYDIAKAERPGTPEDVPLHLLVPAFVLSELHTAFEMGFVIFVPFVVVDLVVASVLMALGMVMVPPSLVSLPVKLLLFVAADGWSLLASSLVRSFQ